MSARLGSDGPWPGGDGEPVLTNLEPLRHPTKTPSDWQLSCEVHGAEFLTVLNSSGRLGGVETGKRGFWRHVGSSPIKGATLVGAQPGPVLLVEDPGRAGTEGSSDGSWCRGCQGWTGTGDGRGSSPGRTYQSRGSSWCRRCQGWIGTGVAPQAGHVSTGAASGAGDGRSRLGAGVSGPGAGQVQLGTGNVVERQGWGVHDLESALKTGEHALWNSASVDFLRVSET